MSDIKDVILNGTTYDIEDYSVREQVQNIEESIMTSTQIDEQIEAYIEEHNITGVTDEEVQQMVDTYLNESADTVIEDWLDNHPEATTTVQDGSITREKLNSNLQSKVGLESYMDANRYHFTDIGKLYTPPANYVAWGSGPKYDRNLHKFVHMLFCAPAHVHSTSTWQRVLIDPVTFETDTPTRVKFYESDGTTEITFAKEADGNSWRMMDDVAGHYQAIKVRSEGGANYKYKYNSYDYGLTWIQNDTRLTMPTAGLDSIDFKLSNGRLLTSYGGPILYSDDDGNTWSQVTPATAGGNYEAECAFIELNTSGSVMAIARYSTPGGTYYGDGRPDPAIISYSNDYGTSWTPWAISTSITDMNAIGCTALKHDGFIELFVSSRWYNGIDNYTETGKRGCIYHYIATLEDAARDKFTNLGIVAYAKGKSAQDLMAGELCLDENHEGLLCIPDSATGESDTCCKWYYKATKTTFFSQLDDNEEKPYKVYSNYKTNQLLSQLERYIIAQVNKAIKNNTRVAPDFSDPNNAYTYVFDGLVANYDFIDSSTYDSTNGTITDTEHGIVATFVSAYNGTTATGTVPAIRDNSVSVSYARVPEGWGSSYFDTMAHEFTYEYSYYLDSNDSLPWAEFNTAYGKANGINTRMMKQSIRKLSYSYLNTSNNIVSDMLTGTNNYYATRKMLNHCVYVYGADGSMKFYINGVLTAQADAPNDFSNWQNDKGTNSNRRNPFKDAFNICGFTRSARLYNKALSADEVNYNYHYELNRTK